jgi:hypothetical protein
MRLGFVMWIVLVGALAGCSSKSEKVTREQCSKVADHIADLLIEHYRTHPDELWDGMTAEPGETGVPKTVTKETFKAYLDSPEGKTWLMQRQGQARSGTEAGIKPCVDNATPKQVKCLLAAKSRDDVNACDSAR